MDEPFNKVFDVVESLLTGNFSNRNPITLQMSKTFGENVRSAFEKHVAAYSLDMSHLPYRFLPRASRAQGHATQKALEIIRENNMEAADSHLCQAIEHLHTRQFADSIVDSIHAVESVARRIDPKANKTLGRALDSLKNAGLLKHPALKEAFSQLYGYTNDEQGIRHALLDKGSPDVDLDEAVFMFGACASFAAYLVNKHQKAKHGKGGGP